MAGPGAKVLAELADLIAEGHLEVPIANVYPLAQVREAYTELELRHTHGKTVLRPWRTRAKQSLQTFLGAMMSGSA
ncbi:zinc-binding dehydrogenase [Streptomyces sp. YIM S03343]